MKKKLLFILPIVGMVLSGCSIIDDFINSTLNPDNNNGYVQPSDDVNGDENKPIGGENNNNEQGESGETGNTGNDNKGDDTDYYASINIDSPTLLDDLRALNNKMRKSTVGYSAMGTSVSGMFKYTDYDPDYVKYDSNGQPYGTRILSFYSGISTTSWNREHVWPNSRGGGSKGNATGTLVDSDIYMPRPTISSENSNRGNSAYVEGMCHTSNGWDPVTAFADNIGVYQGIRGECARIIFYCMTANSSLKLVDNADESNSSKVSMGKLTDLIKWSLENPVNDREKRRNDGGEYLQGNRNAFVDHPEYVCKIWGTTNAKTKSLCGIK